VKRREFITLLGGAATWPFAARGQQIEQERRIGLLTGEDYVVFVGALREELHKLGCASSGARQRRSFLRSNRM
jgi:hypothetical protein